MAIAALLLGALAPSISHALQGAGSSAWVELCSALGSRWIAVGAADVGPADAPPPSAHAGAHCPYCALQAAGMAPPPVCGGALLSLRFKAPQPRPAVSSALSVWHSAQPRGPPQA